MVEVFLIRHGETPDSVAGIFAGRRDTGLSDRGRNQARDWGWVSRDTVRSFFLASPLKRALETTREAGVRKPLVNPDLIEWDLGPLEMENTGHYREKNPGWELFRDGPPPPGESVDSVVARVDRLISQYLESEDRERVFAFSHGQVIKVISMRLIRNPVSVASSLTLGPGRAVRLYRGRDTKFRVVGWNCSAVEARNFQISDLI